jgi:hypothetical protein
LSNDPETSPRIRALIAIGLIACILACRQEPAPTPVPFPSTRRPVAAVDIRDADDLREELAVNILGSRSDDTLSSIYCVCLREEHDMLRRDTADSCRAAPPALLDILRKLGVANASGKCSRKPQGRVRLAFTLGPIWRWPGQEGVDIDVSTMPLEGTCVGEMKTCDMTYDAGHWRTRECHDL